MSAKLAIVILNYRTAELALDCLASLERQLVAGDEVVVVDNASGDGSADRIEEEIARRGYGSWARVVRSPVNGGFAAGNNLGIRSAEADLYALLNSDTIVLPGAIAGLRDALHARPDVGLIGPSMEGAEGGHENSAFRLPNPVTELIRGARTGIITRWLHRFDTDLELGEAPLEPEWIGFACVLIRREVISQIGLLDDGYFMYFEDIDYCRRARNAGWRILYWPRARVVHLLGGSSGVTSSEAALRPRPRYFYEARARYFAKFYGLPGLWLANLLWGLGCCISLIRERIEGRRPHHPEGENRGVWVNALAPLRASAARLEPGAKDPSS